MLKIKNAVATGKPFLVNKIRIIGGKTCQNCNSSGAGILSNLPNAISPPENSQPENSVTTKTVLANSQTCQTGLSFVELKNVPNVCITSLNTH